jgi:glycerol-3-phosphate dehydrogenase
VTDLSINRFELAPRPAQLDRLANEHFDIAVIGGGINGAAVARDAALRGLRVALVEKGDFAGATSSRSSKLIHGGLRYLPQGHLLLVYQALRERERLMRLTAPHLVKPIRFLMPLYRGRGFGPLAMGVGLTLYDLFALAPHAQWHRTLGASAARELEPALREEELRGAALYYDAWSDDARLTLENVLDAAYHGAAVVNYVALEGFARAAGRLAAAHVCDRISGRTIELRARVVVNAAGPWVDDVRMLDDRSAAPSVRLTKGAHIVIPRERLPVRESLVLSDHGGRLVFVMPHDRYVLIGTTDTDFAGDREQVVVDRDDIGYLLGVMRESLPSIALSEADVASSFAGLRALLRSDGGAPSSISREEMIIESPAGLLSVAGGKLTTHRRIADKVVARAMKDLGRPPGVSPTTTVPLPGARGTLPDEAQVLEVISRDAAQALHARYGTHAILLARLIADRPELGRPLGDGCPALGAEVIHSIRCEMTQTLADFLVRRTGLVWRAPREAEAAAPAAARLMATELGWSAAREQAELAGFASDLKARRAA